MKKLIHVLTCSLVVLIAAACNSNNDNTSRNEPEKETKSSVEVAEEKNEKKFEENKEVRKDADFVVDQVASNYADVALARLATKRSDNSEIKKVAKMLEEQHQKTLKELQALASKKSISVPKEADDNGKKEIQEFADMKEVKNFNEDWCKEMVDTHEKTINEFERQLETTKDADLKAWIGQTLPSLRSHLDQLKACHEKMKDS
jgi:putative membrane protein